MLTLVVVAMMWTKAGADIEVTYKDFKSSIACQNAVSSLKKIDKLSKGIELNQFFRFHSYGLM